MSRTLKIPDAYLNVIIQASVGRGDNSNTFAIVGPASGGSFTAVNEYLDPNTALTEVGPGRVYNSMLAAWSNGADKIKFARIGGTNVFDNTYILCGTGSSKVGHDATDYCNREYLSVMDMYLAEDPIVTYTNQFGHTGSYDAGNTPDDDYADVFYVVDNEKFNSVHLRYGSGQARIEIPEGRGPIVDVEYWNGSWVTLPGGSNQRLDGSEYFLTWDLEDTPDWKSTTVATGMTGYAVRFKVLNAVELSGSSVTVSAGSVSLVCGGGDGAYSTEVLPGEALWYYDSGYVFVGIVSSITDNNTIVLVAGSATDYDSSANGPLYARPWFVMAPNIYLTAQKIGALPPWKEFYQGDTYVGHHGWQTTTVGIQTNYVDSTVTVDSDYALGESSELDIVGVSGITFGDAIYNQHGQFIGIVTEADYSTGGMYLRLDRANEVALTSGESLYLGTSGGFTSGWEDEEFTLELDIDSIPTLYQNYTVEGSWTATGGANPTPKAGDFLYASSLSSLSASTFNPYSTISDSGIVGVVSSVTDAGSVLTVTLMGARNLIPDNVSGETEYLYFVRRPEPAMLVMGKEAGSTFDVAADILRLGENGSRLQYNFDLTDRLASYNDIYYQDPEPGSTVYVGGLLSIGAYDTSSLIEQINNTSSYVIAEDLSGTNALPHIDNSISWEFNDGSNGDWSNLSVNDYTLALNSLLDPNHDDIYMVMAVIEEPITNYSIHDGVMTAVVSHCASASGSQYSTPRIALTYFNEAYDVGNINAENDNIQQGENSNRSYAVSSRSVFTIQKAGIPDLTTGILSYARVYFAAAIAGMIANNSPAIPITRKQMTISGLDRVYNPAEQEILIEAGVCIATINDQGVYVVRGINSLTLNSVEREISVLRIIDSVGVQIKEQIRSRYVGGVIEGDVLSRVKTTVEQTLGNMKRPAQQGGLISAFQNVLVSQDSTDRTKVNIYFEIIPKLPFNFAYITEYVTDEFQKVTLTGIQIAG